MFIIAQVAEEEGSGGEQRAGRPSVCARGRSAGGGQQRLRARAGAGEGGEEEGSQKGPQQRQECIYTSLHCFLKVILCYLSVFTNIL